MSDFLDEVGDGIGDLLSNLVQAFLADSIPPALAELTVDNLPEWLTRQKALTEPFDTLIGQLSDPLSNPLDGLSNFDIRDPETAEIVLGALDSIVDDLRPLLGNLLSDLSFSLALPEVDSRVKISREPSGLVHIQAENENDLFLGLGFVHATNRLWQMDFQRRIVAGRLAEVLGASVLEEDILQRTTGLYRAAESAYQALTPDTQQIVDTYTAGINAYLDLDLPLPLEFQVLDYAPEPWQPADVLATVKLRSLGLSANFETELFRADLLAKGIPLERIQTLFPPNDDSVTILQPEDLAALPLADTTADAADSLTAEGPMAFPDLDLSGLAANQAVRKLFASSTGGSNNWVVSGEHTATGKPFLANDPHISMQIPSIWHAVHLESPTLEVIGASLPGTPGVAIGRNTDIAWGVTNAFVDVQDLYALPTDFDVTAARQETIQVRGAEAVTIPVRESRFGPVVSDALGLGDPIALRWVSLAETDGSLEAFIGINRAQNWQEFTAALEPYTAPSQNFVYADVEGNIGYITAGQAPIRPFGLQGIVPVATAELLASGRVSNIAELDWQGFVPFDQMPQVYNPERGFIISANNRIAPDEYPFLLGFEYAEPNRARRIQALIEGQENLSLEDMQAIQLDQVSLLFRDFIPVLEAIKPILETTGASDNTLQQLNRLLRWDGNVSPDSTEATVFETWYTELTQLIAAEIGQDRLRGNLTEPAPRFLLRALTEGDPVCGSAEACLANVAETFNRTVAGFGEAIPTWGSFHLATFEHPILPLDRQVPFGGDRYTVNVGTYDPETFLFDSNGSTYRQIIDLGDLDNSVFMLTPGQSGRLLSPYFDNLLEPWQQGEYLPLQTQDFPVANEITLEPEDSNDSLIGQVLSGLFSGVDSLLFASEETVASSFDPVDVLAESAQSAASREAQNDLNQQVLGQISPLQNQGDAILDAMIGAEFPPTQVMLNEVGNFLNSLF
ncbi:MAG: penicillin acylase family protein [Cyanobacteria bacterium P01_A01_bin.114]